MSTVLERLAKICALSSGGLLIAMALGTCASIAGRNLFGVSVVGDFELTGAACGIAIALCLPWCQWRSGNIVVDFFTSRASSHTIARLDRFGAGLVAIAMALVAWRTGVGGLNAYQNQSASMLLGLPDWIVNASMVGPMILTAIIAAWQSLGPPMPHATDAL
jgi:TRAP-type C4-dicarboxylate transport system permease small subunit